MSMKKKSAKKQENTYIRDFRARLVFIRTTMEWSQPEMARRLGIKIADTYAKYENRKGSLLPPSYWEALSRETGYSMEFIVSGKGSIPQRAAS